MSAETDWTQAWFYENEAKRTREDWKKKCAKIKRKKWWTIIVLLPDAQTAPEIVQISLFTSFLKIWHYEENGENFAGGPIKVLRRKKIHEYVQHISKYLTSSNL